MHYYTEHVDVTLLLFIDNATNNPRKGRINMMQNARRKTARFLSLPHAVGNVFLLLTPFVCAVLACTYLVRAGGLIHVPNWHFLVGACILQIIGVVLLFAFAKHLKSWARELRSKDEVTMLKGILGYVFTGIVFLVGVVLILSTLTNSVLSQIPAIGIDGSQLLTAGPLTAFVLYVVGFVLLLQSRKALTDRVPANLYTRGVPAQPAQVSRPAQSFPDGGTAVAFVQPADFGQSAPPPPSDAKWFDNASPSDTSQEESTEDDVTDDDPDNPGWLLNQFGAQEDVPASFGDAPASDDESVADATDIPDEEPAQADISEPLPAGLDEPDPVPVSRPSSLEDTVSMDPIPADCEDDERTATHVYAPVPFNPSAPDATPHPVVATQSQDARPPQAVPTAQPVPAGFGNTGKPRTPREADQLGWLSD